MALGGLTAELGRSETAELGRWSRAAELGLCPIVAEVGRLTALLGLHAAGWPPGCERGPVMLPADWGRVILCR